MVTKNGIIKKTPLKDFANVRRSGLMAITLKKGDSLQKVGKSTRSDELILITKKGQSIRFPEKAIREMGRQASGVKGIRLKGNDDLVGMEVIRSMKYEEVKIFKYFSSFLRTSYFRLLKGFSFKNPFCSFFYFWLKKANFRS